jgi:hypothetical protein
MFGEVCFPHPFSFLWFNCFVFGEVCVPLFFLAFCCMCLIVLFDLCPMLLVCLWIVHSWLPLRLPLTFMYCTLEYITGLQDLENILKQGWYVELTTSMNLYSLVNVGSTVQYTVTWYQGQETVYICTVSINYII